MDITLIFPPHWAPFQPYLSLPTLTGFLRKEGYKVTQRDVNIEAMDYFTSTFSVKNIYKKIKERAKWLRTVENRSEKEEMELTCLSLCENSYDVTRQSKVSK
ncbi:MAG: B12-binding domain-containing radical SAM protein, partial [Candidatus Eremiobacterota bacterium]